MKRQPSRGSDRPEPRHQPPSASRRKDGAGSPREEIGFALRLANAAVYADLVATLRPFDIRPSEYATLRMICATPGIRQSAIGTAVGVKGPNLVAMIARLESLGLITKARAKDDRRANGLKLTGAGDELFTRADAAHSGHRARLAAVIGMDEWPGLLDMLYRLAALEKVQPGD